jgi:RNA polymerase sigma-70 factor (ECF subfamily)
MAGTIPSETRAAVRGVEWRALQSDRELVAASASGDPQAFHGLVDRHGPDLLRLARSLCRTRSDAEDVVQETFAGAFRGLSRFDGRSSVRTWLSRILVRQAAKAWNRSRRHRGVLTLESPEAQSGGWRMPDGRGGAVSATSRAELRLDLRQILDSLGEDHRQVILMREIQGMSYAEMAEALGIPRGTIESRLHRARGELRRLLEGYVS